MYSEWGQIIVKCGIDENREIYNVGGCGDEWR